MKKLTVSLMTSILIIGATHASVYSKETSTVDVAKRNGVKSCLGQVKSIAEHVLGSKAHSTHGITKQGAANEHMFLSMNVKGYSDGDSHVVISSTPTDSGCDGFYVETSFMQMSCEKIQSDVFTGWKLSQTLNKNTVLLTNGSGTVHIYLSPQQGDTCLVSKQETVYG
jgi:hypothetical protein